jgi:hypothetical protein
MLPRILPPTVARVVAILSLSIVVGPRDDIDDIDIDINPATYPSPENALSF